MEENPRRVWVNMCSDDCHHKNQPQLTQAIFMCILIIEFICSPLESPLCISQQCYYNYISTNVYLEPNHRLPPDRDPKDPINILKCNRTLAHGQNEGVGGGIPSFHQYHQVPTIIGHKIHHLDVANPNYEEPLLILISHHLLQQTPNISKVVSYVDILIHLLKIEKKSSLSKMPRVKVFFLFVRVKCRIPQHFISRNIGNPLRFLPRNVRTHCISISSPFLFPIIFLIFHILPTCLSLFQYSNLFLNLFLSIFHWFYPPHIYFTKPPTNLHLINLNT